MGEYKVYKIGQSIDNAASRLIQLMGYRSTVEESFKKKFLDACHNKNIELNYYPVVKKKAHLTRVTFNYSTTASYVSGYRGTIENDRVELHKEYQTYEYHGSETIYASDLKYRTATAMQIDEHINNVCEGSIEYKHIKFNSVAVTTAKNACQSMLYSSLRSAANQAAIDSKKGKVSDLEFTYETEKEEVLFYPMYVLSIDGYTFYVNGVDGSIPEFNYPRNAAYYNELSRNKRKDIIPQLYYYILFALTLAAMIYVLYTVITAELNTLHVGDFNIYGENNEDITFGWVAVIGGNILVCAVWLIFLAFALFFGKTGPYAHQYQEAEKEGMSSQSISYSKSVVGFYLYGILMVVIGCALMAVYAGISSLFVTGGAKYVFGLILHTI